MSLGIGPRIAGIAFQRRHGEKVDYEVDSHNAAPPNFENGIIGSSKGRRLVWMNFFSRNYNGFEAFLRLMTSFTMPDTDGDTRSVRQG